MGKKPSRSRLVELYHEQDLTQKAVGGELGVSSPTVAKWLREENIETRKPRDQDLITDLQRVAERVDGTPSFNQYREHGEYGANTVKRRFDGWNNAIEAAGLTPNTKGTPLSDAELVKALRDLADELGRSPTQADINEHTPHTHKTYYRRFDGGLSEAKERAGLTPNQAGTRVSIECANCGDDLERLESNVAEKERVYCSYACLAEYRHEQYDPEADPQNKQEQVECEQCGNAIWRSQWLLNNRDRHFCGDGCYSKWCSDFRQGENHPQWTEYPTLECDWCGKAYKTKPAKAGDSRFCSLECINSWKSEEYQTETERFTYMGRDWPEQRQKAILRDQARCQECAQTEREHVEEFGCGLEVHHIEPREEHRDEDGTLDYEAANRLENLVTYCKRCHRLAESGKI